VTGWSAPPLDRTGGRKIGVPASAGGGHAGRDPVEVEAMRSSRHVTRPTRSDGSEAWFVGLLAALILAAAAGGGLVTAAFTLPHGPPQPAANAARPDGTQSGFDADAPQPPPPLMRSHPIRIEIPAIAVNSEIIPVGVDFNGGLQVPPLDQAMLSGWYSLGASPGEFGNAVIVGHVDSQKIGPAVFFNLGRLVAGNVIRVTRQDNTAVRFKVDDVRSYAKNEFPSGLVYGSTDRAQLRLITCGGQFDKKTGSYLNNVVVFASYA
jgi:hypothetical protein